MTKKPHIIAIAVALSALAGAASAGHEILPTIKVPAEVNFAGCNAARSPQSEACKTLRTAILNRFPAWQLGVMFGPTTARQAYRDTGSQRRLFQRYARFLEQYERSSLANSMDPHLRVAGLPQRDGPASAIDVSGNPRMTQTGTPIPRTTAANLER